VTVGDAVNEPVQSPVRLGEAGEQPVDLVVPGDVARFDKGRADGPGQRRDSFEQSFARVTKTERCAFAVKGLGDAPGN